LEVLIIDKNIFCARVEKTNRVHGIEPHPLRNKFQRDRDRILYSKEFRRLSGKTQVFIAGFDDHMRTRLTHTLEVSQIANTIARALGFDEALVEAIAYGHDVGHTPFGHVGERSLNLIMNGCKNIYSFNKSLLDREKGFKHNFQSLHVTINLEKLYVNQPGLNLTPYTLWGILNHSSKEYKKCNYYGDDGKCKLQNRNTKCKNIGRLSLGFYKFNCLNDKEDWTFEAAIVAIADEIAQRHHDIEDGIYAGIIDRNELVDTFRAYFDAFFQERDLKHIEALKKNGDKSVAIACLSRLIIDFYTMNYIQHLRNVLENVKKKYNIGTYEDFYKNKQRVHGHLANETEDKNIMSYLGFEKSFAISDSKFRKFLVDKILYSELAQSMDGKSDFIIRKLFKAYLSNPQQLPDKTIDTICLNFTNQKPVNPSDKTSRDLLKETLKDPNLSKGMEKIVLRTVCDYIAGMTDYYAMSQYEKLYGAQKFRNF